MHVCLLKNKESGKVSHGAIQFTAYEELRKLLVDLKSKKTKRDGADEVLNSVDYTVLGASSKVAATLCTYPFQVIRARLQTFVVKE